jgi:hypothetical protein
MMLERSNPAVDEVLAFMRKNRIKSDDLAKYGGVELKSIDPAIAGKARCVERCWELMARLGVNGSQV